jgi:hypothetical protein
MNTSKYLIAVTFIACIIYSCEKADLSITETMVPEADKAFVKVALLSPGMPNTMIKVNDTKVNSITSFTSTTTNFASATALLPSLFPSTQAFPDYISVPASSNFKFSLANSGTANDSVVLLNTKTDVKAGSYYSMVVADTGVNRTAFLIEDNFQQQKDSFLSVRLINAMVGSTLNLIRIDSNSATDVVRDTLARNIPYKGSSGFIQVRTFTNRAFIRIRIATPEGRNVGLAQIPPQALATGSRRSITYYAGGFLNGTGIFVPGLSPHVTNQ